MKSIKCFWLSSVLLSILGCASCAVGLGENLDEGSRDTAQTPSEEPTANEQCQSKPEICDGIDNDCNGQIDDIVSENCSTGLLGICALGKIQCVDGQTQCIYPEESEICDCLDNDCDGLIDNITQEPCSTGLLGICAQGTPVCQNGSFACLQIQYASIEKCDFIDNNCDGSTDEGFNVGTPCSNGVGQCEKQGLITCIPFLGQATCDAVATPPTQEICDGLDNNCDGNIDEPKQFQKPCNTGKPTPCDVGVDACKNGIYSCTPKDPTCL